MNKIKAAFGFGLSDWLLFFQAWFLLLVVDLGLRFFPFTSLRDWAASRAPNEPTEPTAHTEVDLQNIVRIMGIASRNHLYPMTCLRRSLALQRMLGRRGLPTRLRFGVQKEHGEFQAHAWLEYNGKPVGEPEILTERYTAMLIG